jgi:hypothetical protein
MSGPEQRSCLGALAHWQPFAWLEPRREGEPHAGEQHWLVASVSGSRIAEREGGDAGAGEASSTLPSREATGRGEGEGEVSNRSCMQAHSRRRAAQMSVQPGGAAGEGGEGEEQGPDDAGTSAGGGGCLQRRRRKAPEPQPDAMPAAKSCGCVPPRKPPRASASDDAPAPADYDADAVPP